MATEMGIDFVDAVTKPAGGQPLKQLRTGVFQRYWGGNPDEGWTRLILEQFGFPYVTVRDADLLAGRLSEMIDVLVIPNDPKGLLMAPDLPKVMGQADGCPPEYRSGMGEPGARAIREFVQNGGRLITFGQACSLAIEALGLEVKDVVQGLSTKEYSTHGSTIHAQVNSAHRLASGMPDHIMVYSWDSPAYEISEAAGPGACEAVVKYVSDGLLQSGWLIGEDKIRSRAAMVACKVGKGEAVLFGFRPQNRGQTDGTFKLLFNCLH